MVLSVANEKWKKDKPLYQPRKSNKQGKKGMVYIKKEGKVRLIHFGDSNMEDFTQHKDTKRRASYLARSGGITSKGIKTANNKNFANYWSRKILWNA